MTRRKKEPETHVFGEVEIPEVFAGLETKPKGRRRDEDPPARSVAFGACPGCSANKVGLVWQGGHHAWRDHTYRTHGDIPIQCSAVGQRVCDFPGRDVWSLTGLPTPACPCISR